MKISGKSLLFISSYLPIWLLWIVYSICTQGFNMTIMLFFGIVLTLISVLTGFLFKSTYQTATLDNVKTVFISDITHGSSEAISYLLTLIIPVATSTLQLFGESLDSNIIVTLILVLTIFLIYLRSNLIVMNPTMMLFGYSLYTINYKMHKESEITFNAILISEKSINPQKISSKNILILVDPDIYLLRADVSG